VKIVNGSLVKNILKNGEGKKFYKTESRKSKRQKRKVENENRNTKTETKKPKQKMAEGKFIATQFIFHLTVFLKIF
jgi:spore germination protein GerM